MVDKTDIHNADFNVNLIDFGFATKFIDKKGKYLERD